MSAEFFNLDLLRKYAEGQSIIERGFENKDLNIAHKLFEIYHNNLNLRVLATDLIYLSLIRPYSYCYISAIIESLLSLKWSESEKEQLKQSITNQLIFAPIQIATFSFLQLKFKFLDSQKAQIFHTSCNRAQCPFVIAIANDDVGELINLTNEPDFSYDMIVIEDNITQSLISFSCYCSSINCFKYLLLNNAPIDSETLRLASAGGNPEICRILEQKGHSMESHISTMIQYHRNDLISWQTQFSFDPSYIPILMKYGNIVCFLDLYDRLGFNDTQYHSFSKQSIHFLICSENTHSFYDNVIGEFPRNNDKDKLEIALEKGAKIDWPDDENLTPFTLAVMSNNFYAAQTLFDHGANPNVQDVYNITPLQHAIEFHNLDMLKFLIEKCNANVSTCDVLGTACSQGSLFIVKYLVNVPNVQLNFISQDRMTPLLLAAEAGNKEIVDFLLQVPGVDIYAENSYGNNYKDFLN